MEDDLPEFIDGPTAAARIRNSRMMTEEEKLAAFGYTKKQIAERNKAIEEAKELTAALVAEVQEG